MNIGFIGLGNMGFPMARRLIEAGHKLTVYDTNGQMMSRLTSLGAAAATSPRDVADKAETVMASLPSPDAVLAVATGTDGVIDGKKVKRFVDLSTTGSRMAVKVAELLKARNILQIDSPVSGGVGGAEKGTLAVMVAAPRAEFEALKPVFEIIGKVFFIGEKPGMGQTMKLCNNLLSAAAMAISSEAMVMGVKAGLDPNIMVDVINSGSGMNTATRDKFPRSIIPRAFDYGFYTGLMYKDVRLCLEEGEALGVPMGVGGAVRQLWQIANNELGPGSDFTEVVKCVERWSGAEVRAKESK
jgi:3-hydroxyisobutyrate dehydrogenase-like beta-hydroxyacid dehydrogenase